MVAPNTGFAFPGTTLGTNSSVGVLLVCPSKSWWHAAAVGVREDSGYSVLHCICTDQCRTLRCSQQTERRPGLSCGSGGVFFHRFLALFLFAVPIVCVCVCGAAGAPHYPRCPEASGHRKGGAEEVPPPPSPSRGPRIPPPMQASSLDAAWHALARVDYVGGVSTVVDDTDSDGCMACFGGRLPGLRGPEGLASDVAEGWRWGGASCAGCGAWEAGP